MHFFTQQTFAWYLIWSDGLNVDETKRELNDKYQVLGLQEAVLEEAYLSFFGLNRQKTKTAVVYMLNLRNSECIQIEVGLMESWSHPWTKYIKSFEYYYYGFGIF